MSKVVASLPAEQIKLHSATPSFIGLVGGELFKITRQWTTWLMAVLLAGIITLPYLIRFTVSSTKASINNDAFTFLYNNMATNFSVLRAFGGIFLIIMTARVIGLEYQLGTIRILLARGVGRLQLLSAKLFAIVIVTLILLAGGLLLNALLMSLLLTLVSGNLNALNSLTPTFWADTRLYILTIMISMGVTILMTTAVTVLGRSLSFGLTVGVGWFAADNLGVVFMLLAYRLTNNDFWLNITSYFLGPNLNVMPTVLLSRAAFSIGTPPLVKVDGTHTLVVTLVYALIFAAVAIILTWRRDVKE